MEHDHLLMAYADGELDAAAASGVEQLLATDPQARIRVAMYRDTAALLRAACGEPDSLAMAPVRGRTTMPRGRLALAVAASLGLGVLGFGAGRLWPGGAEPDLLTEIAEYHAVIARETTNLAELPPSRADEAMAWLGARLSRTLRVPELQATSLHFAGVRLLVFDGEPVADLLYTRDHAPPVALCIARANGASRPIRLARRDGLQLATWRDGSYAYVVAGELDPMAARDIAERAAVQLHL